MFRCLVTLNSITGLLQHLQMKSAINEIESVTHVHLKNSTYIYFIKLYLFS